MSLVQVRENVGARIDGAVEADALQVAFQVEGVIHSLVPRLRLAEGGGAGEPRGTNRREETADETDESRVDNSLDEKSGGHVEGEGYLREALPVES